MKRHLLVILSVILAIPWNMRAVPVIKDGDDDLVSITVTSEQLSSIFQRIESQTSYSIVYDEAVSPLLSQRKSLSVTNTPVIQVMSNILKDTGLVFDIKDRQIIVSFAKKQAGAKSSVVSGTVISASDNMPIIGAGVMVDGKTEGAVVTDLDGNYSITVPSGARELVFTCLGFEDRKLSLSQPVLLKVVTMTEASSLLDDAVVVAFGKQKKESLVSSITTINPSELKVTTSSLTTALAGRVAGVITVQSSGEPGADGANFWIRGVSTFGSNKSPLILLDGVEIDNTTLNMIAPETIEQFSVLKDATATALYGSRGANGVLLITTKSGKESDRMAINIRAENGWTMPTRVTPIADGVTYMQNYNEARRNDNLPDYYSEEKIIGTRLGLDPVVFPNNDWYSLLFKPFAMNQTLNFNMRGGSKRIDYFLNFSAIREDSILRGDNFSEFDVSENVNKYLFQSNVSASVTKTTKLSLKMTSQFFDTARPYSTPNALFLLTMQSNPVLFPAVFPAQENDTHVRYGSAPSWGTGDYLSNPLAELNYGYNDSKAATIITTFDVDQDLSFITKGLKASFMASFKDYLLSQRKNYKSPYYYTLSNYVVNPDATFGYEITQIGSNGSEYLNSSNSSLSTTRFNLQASLDYARTFGKHNVAATFVYLQSETVNNNSTLPYRSQGIAGRATYNFDSRYILEGNFGYNGSENFAAGHRWGFFPSVAAGWVVSNEPFFPSSLKDKLSLLKFRVSYGLSGNDGLPQRFPYLSDVIIYAGRGAYFGKDEIITYTAGVISSWGNPDATWEVSRKLDIGVELGLFNNLTLVADVFKEHRSGIFMLRRTVSVNTGFQSQSSYANIGEADNIGIDASLDYRKVFSKDFTLSAQGTFTFARNSIVARDEPAHIYSYQSQIGKPISNVYGYVATGLFSSQEEIDSSPRQDLGSVLQPGDIKYADLNADGVVDGYDQTYLGGPLTPEISYGFGISLNYKKFDCSFFFQGASNVSIVMQNHHPFLTTSVAGINMAQWIADDHWTPENTSGYYPRLSSIWNTNNTVQSTYWMKDGSYLRLKNFEIGYSFSKFRAFASGSNLFTISPFKYWDPEMGTGNGLSYPIQRVFKVGLQFNY